MKNILVTGGAGFIGSHFVDYLIESDYQNIIVLDKLTYAGNKSYLPLNKIKFIEGDICDKELVAHILELCDVDTVVNIAAETHVDNSIHNPEVFVETNVNGTACLLKCSFNHWKKIGHRFKYLQMSTDEVYGSLGEDGFFTEKSPVKPNSPYASSKAAADHLVHAWWHTYGFPAMITRCSNNYGPRQFPEKLIPRTIASCIVNQPIPVHGDGRNVRDWIYVKDHCKGVLLALEKGESGQVYGFGGNNCKRNIEIVEYVCNLLDELKLTSDKTSHKDLIAFVKDRPGNDYRYAFDYSYSSKQLGFKPSTNFEEALKATITWYIKEIEIFQTILSQKKD